MLSNEAIREYLAQLRARETGMWNIDPADGEYLYALVKELNAKRVLEIGTSNGYSAIWIALALRATGGRLITLEADRGRYELAQAHFEETGLAPLIDSRLGDALAEIDHIEPPLDIAFLDAAKSEYVRYYDAVLPKVRSGGVILAHNVVSHAGELRDFLEKVQSDPAVETEMIAPGPQGFSVSRVK